MTGRPVGEAKVSVLGRGLAAGSAEDGAFALEVAAWPATLVVARPGYRVARVALARLPDQPLEISLDPIVSYTDRIEVTATRAREGLDPATFTNIPQERVSESYWGQDPAMLLPSWRPASSPTTTAATASATRTSPCAASARPARG